MHEHDVCCLVPENAEPVGILPTPKSSRCGKKGKDTGKEGEAEMAEWPWHVSQYLPIRSFLRHFRSLSWAFFLALSRPLLGPYPRSPIAILSFQTAVTSYKLVTLSRGQGEGHHRFVDLPTPSILWPRVRILRTPSNMLMAYNHLIVIKYHFVNVPVKEWPCYYLLKSFWLREQDGKEV